MYSGGSQARRERGPLAVTPPVPHHLAHLTTPPAELGLIGAELAKRLTLAAEEFLAELAAEQVRGSFRAELGDPVEEEPQE
jgi:hypothetical protein